MRFIIEGVVLTIVGVFGIVTNIAAVLFFGAPQRRQQRFYALMLALAVVDILVISSFIWFCSIPEFMNRATQSYYWSIWLFPLLHIFCSWNICLTVAISLDRYLAICKPLFYHAYRWPTKAYLFSIF